MQPLGESWDVVEVVRSLVTEVDSAAEDRRGTGSAAAGVGRPAAPRPLITVGDLVAEAAGGRRWRLARRA